MRSKSRIGPRHPRKIYLSEWREHRGLTQKQLGERLDVADMTISRWENGKALLNTDVMAAVAEALNIEPADLYRHPNQPSADELLRGATPEVRQRAIAIIQAAIGKLAS